MQSLFIEDGQVVFPVPAFRYLLGLSDLTGELMRFATNAAGSGEAGEVVIVVLSLIRDLRASEPFSFLEKGWGSELTI